MQSSISSSYWPCARYHSSMVNSGWCSGPLSRLRKERANSKMRRSPAASSFLQANSGEVRRNRRSRRGWRNQFRPQGVQMGLVAGRYLQDRGLDLDEFHHREQVAHRARDFAPGNQERSALGMGVGRPESGSTGHQASPQSLSGGYENRWRSGAGSVCCAPTLPAASPGAGRRPQARMHIRESHRQLAPQRQYPRTRRR